MEPLVIVSLRYEPFEIKHDENTGLYIYENIIRRNEITGLWPKAEISYKVIGPLTLHITIETSKKTFDFTHTRHCKSSNYDIFDFPLDKYGDGTDELILKIKPPENISVEISIKPEPIEILRDDETDLWPVYENIIRRDKKTGLWPKANIMYDYIPMTTSPIRLYIIIENSKNIFYLTKTCNELDVEPMGYLWFSDVFDLPLDKYGDETDKLILKIKPISADCKDKKIVKISIKRDEKTGLWPISENIILRDEITGLWPKAHIFYDFYGCLVTHYITIENSKKTFYLTLCDLCDLPWRYEHGFPWTYIYDLLLDEYGDETSKLILKIQAVSANCENEMAHTLKNMSI